MSQVRCNGVCYDLGTNSQHCGMCGRACSAGLSCNQGNCGVRTCGMGMTLCGNDCAPLQEDPNNCGACGNRCTGKEPCVGGVCRPLCGGALQECCVGTTPVCQNSLPCRSVSYMGRTGSFCMPLNCGFINEPCCNGSCLDDFTCTAGTCR
jgi:hypothetical protein